MASDSLSGEADHKFTWNELVKIKDDAPANYFPGGIAVVCGMERVKSIKLAKEFSLNIEDWLYTVEFGDGSSIELPECYLELLTD